MNNISTATPRHPHLLYASSRTSRGSGTATGSDNDDGDELHSAGTLAGTLILARKQRLHGKQAIKSEMTCKMA